MSEKESCVIEQDEEFESKLVPILREGIEIVKMILFKELQGYIGSLYADHEKNFINKLTGTVMNELFGTQNPEPSFVAFAAENEQTVGDILGQIDTKLEHLRIPLTDALRIMVLCDHQEGIDNSQLLRQADEYGILLTEREVPMPNKFIELVRRLGASHGLIAPPTTH